MLEGPTEVGEGTDPPELCILRPEDAEGGGGRLGKTSGAEEWPDLPWQVPPGRPSLRHSGIFRKLPPLRHR